MPYIKQEFRDALDPGIYNLAASITSVYKHSGVQTRDGMLNYIITKLLDEVYRNKTYHDHNEIFGMLECCKLEYYRKRTGPYEDEKEKQNGTV